MSVLTANLLGVLPDGKVLEEIIKRSTPEEIIENLPEEISPQTARLLFKKVDTAEALAGRLTDAELLESLITPSEKRDRVLSAACHNRHANLETKTRLMQWTIGSQEGRYLQKTLLKDSSSMERLHLLTLPGVVTSSQPFRDLSDDDIIAWAGDPRVLKLPPAWDSTILNAWAHDSEVDVSVLEAHVAARLGDTSDASHLSLQICTVANGLTDLNAPKDRALKVLRAFDRAGWHGAAGFLLDMTDDPDEARTLMGRLTDEEILDAQRTITRALSTSLDVPLAERYVKVMEEADATIVQGFEGPLPEDVLDVLDTCQLDGFRLLHAHLRGPQEVLKRIEESSPGSLYIVKAPLLLLEQLVEMEADPITIKALLTHHEEVPEKVRCYLRDNGTLTVAAESCVTGNEWEALAQRILAEDPSPTIDRIIRRALEIGFLETSTRDALMDHYQGSGLGDVLRDRWPLMRAQEGLLTRLAAGNLIDLSVADQGTIQSAANQQPWVAEYAQFVPIRWDRPMGKELAAHVRKILHAGLGTDPDRWEVAKTLMATWKGTVPHLVEAVDLTLKG